MAPRGPHWRAVVDEKWAMARRSPELANTGWLLGDRVVRLIVALVVSTALARHLGPDGLGALTFAVSWTALFAAFAGLGLDSLIVRELVRTPGSASEVLGTALLMRAVGGLLATVTAPLLAWWIEPETGNALLVAAASLASLFSASDVLSLWFQHKTQSKVTVKARGYSFFLMAAGRLALIGLEADLVWFAACVALESLLALAAVALAYRADHLRPGKWNVSKTLAIKLLHEGWPLLLASVSVTLYLRLDQVLLPQWAGNHEAGLYGAAVRLSEMWYVIPAAIVQSVMPGIVKKAHSSDAEMLVSLASLFRWLVVISYGAAILLTVAAPLVTTVLFGEDFAAAAPVLAVHAWSGVFVALGTARAIWDSTMSETRFAFASTLSGACLNFGLNWLWIPKHGAVGAALATVIAYAFAAVGATLIYPKSRHIGVLMLRSLVLLKTRH